MLISQRRNTKKGFTIVELLVIVVVIGILAAITIVSYNGVQQRSRDSVRSTALRSIVEGLELYYLKNGNYPDACNVLNTGCGMSNLKPILVPEFIDALPADPGPGESVSYVVGGTSEYWGRNYGILVKFESKPACRYLRGDNPPTGWWPSYPICVI